MNIEYNWSTDHTKQQGEIKMSKSKYTFEKGSEKRPAGDVVDGLVRQFLADSPTESYETGLKRVLSLHENRALSAAYGKHPATMI